MIFEYIYLYVYWQNIDEYHWRFSLLSTPTLLPSRCFLLWLALSMSGMVHQDLTQFFITCLFLIPCTGVEIRHRRLSKRMGLRWWVLNQMNLCLQMTEGNAKMVPPVNWDLFIPRFSTCQQKQLINTRPTHQSPTRSSNCSREMPEAESHPNWEHISWLFRKCETPSLCLKVLKCSKLVILVVSSVKRKV